MSESIETKKLEDCPRGMKFLGWLLTVLVAIFMCWLFILGVCSVSVQVYCDIFQRIHQTFPPQ